MKFRTIFSISLVVLAAILFLGNSNGRATSANAGNTGAPGDAALPNGTPITCQGCHNSGSFSPTLSITVLDGMGQSIAGYQPESEYTVRVSIAATGVPKGYGFQMVSLKNSGNTSTGQFIDMGANNYKLKTLNTTQRTYAEHSGVSPSNTFDVRWKAPATGTGDVTFYAAGNAVNGNENTGGDGSAHSKITLTEGFLVSSSTPVEEDLSAKIYPNPTADYVTINTTLPQGGNYLMTVFSQTGQVIFVEKRVLQKGENEILLNTSTWKPDIYSLKIENEGKSTAIRFLKI